MFQKIDTNPLPKTDTKPYMPELDTNPLPPFNGKKSTLIAPNPDYSKNNSPIVGVLKHTAKKKKISSSSSVSSQESSSETEDIFVCNICRREFNHKRNLVDHFRGHHQGTKPHKCPHEGCTKSFLRPAHLQIHFRIHTGEKPFHCEYPGCDKKWNQKSALKQHMRSHTGEKPFDCNIPGCNKKFSTSSSCKRHVSTHEKPASPLLSGPKSIKKRNSSESFSSIFEGKKNAFQFVTPMMEALKEDTKEGSLKNYYQSESHLTTCSQAEDFKKMNLGFIINH